MLSDDADVFISSAPTGAAKNIEGRAGMLIDSDDDQRPPEFDDWFFLGKDRPKRPKMQKKVSISLTPPLIAYLKNFHHVSRFVSACIRSAPKELILHYQRKIAKEKRDRSIQGRSMPFDISIQAYGIYSSIPKRLRSAFVRDCLLARPSFEHVMLSEKEMEVMKLESEKARLSRKKKKKED